MLTPRSPLTPIRLPFNPPLAGGTCATGSSESFAPRRALSTVNVIRLAGCLALILYRMVRAGRPDASIPPHDPCRTQAKPRLVSSNAVPFAHPFSVPVGHQRLPLPANDDAAGALGDVPKVLGGACVGTRV